MTDTSIIDVALTAADRCDRCGAPARAKAALVSGELLFCGHHARMFAEQLTSKAVAVYDPEGFLHV